MIARLSGQLVEKKEQSLLINVSGLCYEAIVPSSVLARIDETKDEDGRIHLVIYHYFQISPSRGIPVLIGFINEIERDFFQQFIKVSGIGPRAAVKAFNMPISEIARAIDLGDAVFLKKLPGIGAQKAKEIVAKLQGKMGRYGLIQDRSAGVGHELGGAVPHWQEEALEVLLQLQYKKQEANKMIQKALDSNDQMQTTEELLNEIYKQKVLC